MGLMGEISALLRKDLLLEWRQKYALGGIVLYVLVTVFVIYLILQQDNLTDRLDYRIWSIFFWITILFAAVNAIAKSFTQESKDRQLYYYTLVSPQAVILSKMVYNALLMLLLSGLSLLTFALIIGSPVQQYSVFLTALLLGGMGFSFLFTMISAIASKAQNNSTLMAILGFPIILPLLMLLQKLSQNAFLSGLANDTLGKDILVLGAFDVLLVSLAYILFPYLWRD